MAKVISLFAVLCLAAALPLAAQSTQPQSLGDVARQLRQKDKDAKKAGKVVTNDNLPPPVPGEALTILPATAAIPAKPEASPSKPATAQPETSSVKPQGPEAPPKTREGWQAKFRAAREDLAKAKEMQQLSEDELNLMQIQEAREINANAKAELDAKIQAKQSDVDLNRDTNQRAQKALDDLQKQFDESGAPEDWSVTEPPKETPQS